MNAPDTPILTTLTRVFGSIHAGLGVLIGSALLMELHPVIPTVLLLLSVALGAVQAGLKHYAQSKAMPAEAVVEFARDYEVVAGPANDRVADGIHVRPLDPVLPMAREGYGH